MKMFDWFLCAFVVAVAVFHFKYVYNHPNFNRYPASETVEVLNWHWECGKV